MGENLMTKKEAPEPAVKEEVQDEEKAEKGPFKIYDSIPASLKSELLVSHTTSLDPEEAATRMELIRTHTPAELSQIHGLSDIPVPAIIENLMTKKEAPEPAVKEEVQEEEKAEKGPFMIYDSIPASLKSE